jgi:hypothetical protein
MQCNPILGPEGSQSKNSKDEPSGQAELEVEGIQAQLQVHTSLPLQTLPAPFRKWERSLSQCNSLVRDLDSMVCCGVPHSCALQCCGFKCGSIHKSQMTNTSPYPPSGMRHSPRARGPNRRQIHPSRIRRPICLLHASANRRPRNIISRQK